MPKAKHVWMVRAGDDNILADMVEGNAAVAVGWDKMGDLSSLQTRSQYKEQYTKAYPEDSKGRIPVNAGQVYRFVREISEGDYVLTYNQSTREILIGTILGEYQYKPKLFAEDYPNIRKVTWIKKISRDEFTPPARNSMGSVLTVFNLDDYLNEIETLLAGKKPDSRVVEEAKETPSFYSDTKSKADVLISDLISHLEPYEFQNLVAAVLRAMEFRAKSSPPGRDKGVDIIAYPDVLGLGNPRIKVQVKHRVGPATGPEMQQLIGILKENERGLFVSTGGFTSDARTEAAHSAKPITLLDREGFVEIMLEYYEKLESEYKALVRLKRIWLPFNE